MRLNRFSTRRLPPRRGLTQVLEGDQARALGVDGHNRYIQVRHEYPPTPVGRPGWRDLAESVSPLWYVVPRLTVP